MCPGREVGSVVCDDNLTLIFDIMVHHDTVWVMFRVQGHKKICRMKTFLAMCAHCETRWTWSAEKQT